MSHARSNLRKIRSAVGRVDQQAYDFAAGRRLPRGGGGGQVYLCCRLTGSLAAATGTFPGLTPGRLNSQQVYIASYDAGADTYSLVAIGGADATVLNYTGASFVTGKTTRVSPAGPAGAFCVDVQDC